jgi:iron complex outermembrane receptor protein
MRGIGQGGMKRVRPLLPAVLLASTMLTGVTAARAADPSKDQGLGEVIVTAQKREENLQHVPVSIQALGEKKLEQLDVSGFNDYAKYLPSVAFTNVSPGFAKIYMRGVASGGDGNHSGSQPSVGVYLDEQPVTTIQGPLDIHVYDIARVESLSGPQGTLYGASSEAGTIRIITNKPSTAGFSAGYNLEGNTVNKGGAGYTAEGFVNLPIGDKVAVRLVGWDEHDAGYIDNVPGTLTYPTGPITIHNTGLVKKDYNDLDTIGGRAALKIDLNDNWTLTPTVMGEQQKSHGSFGYDPSIGDLKVAHYYPENSNDRWYQAALTLQGKISNFDITYAGAYLKRNADTQSDYTDYSAAYDAAYGSYFVDNGGGLINPSQHINGKDRYTKESHELRISSPKELRIRAIAGVFYERQTHGIEQVYLVDGLAQSLWVGGTTGFPHKDTWWLTEQSRIDRDKAVFGEVYFDITDKLTATVGGRLFNSRNTLEGFYGFGAGNNVFAPKGPGENSLDPATGLPSCNYAVHFRGAPCEDAHKGTNETNSTYKGNLTYKFDNQKLVYATYSKGFRPGGVNRAASLPAYKSDFLTNYELGWKTSWFNNTVRWNGDVYYDKWDNFQFAFLGQFSLTQIVNAGQADMRGVESDVSWAVDHSLTLTGSAAYTDAKITQDYTAGKPDIPANVQAPKGTQLPVTPRFKANATARYVFDLGSWNAHLQGDIVYQDASWADLRILQRTNLGQQPAYTLVDVSGGVEKNRMTFELVVKNLFDERAQLVRYAQCDSATCSRNYVVPSQPRTIALKFGQKF